MVGRRFLQRMKPMKKNILTQLFSVELLNPFPRKYTSLRDFFTPMIDDSNLLWRVFENKKVFLVMWKFYNNKLLVNALSPRNWENSKTCRSVQHFIEHSKTSNNHSNVQQTSRPGIDLTFENLESWKSIIWIACFLNARQTELHFFHVTLQL